MQFLILLCFIYIFVCVSGMEWDKFNAAQALSWPLNYNSFTDPSSIWLRDLTTLILRARTHAKSLVVDMHVDWHQPRLLRLPQEYERLFTVSDQ